MNDGVRSELMGLTRLRIKVYGVVQGVGFRSFVKRIADELNINGYVMNKEDGSVEILAEGEKKNIDVFLDYVSKGPPGSVVENVIIEYEEPKGNLKGFRIRYASWDFW